MREIRTSGSEGGGAGNLKPVLPTPIRGPGWCGVLLFSLFSRRAGGRLGEEGRGDEG